MVTNTHRPETAIAAHRGDHRTFRENTVEAYRAARAAGAAWVELDARRTADGRLVVHHDPVVEGLGPIIRLRRAELPSWLPDLEAALDACAPMGVTVEVKDLPGEEAYDAAHRTMLMVGELVTDRLTGSTSGSTAAAQPLQVSSFFHPALGELAARFPTVPRAYLSAEGWDHLDILAAAAAAGAVAFHPFEADVTQDLVDRVHERGLLVEPWTVNAPDRLRAMVAWGVDRVMTDDIDAALAAGCRPADFGDRPSPR